MLSKPTKPTKTIPVMGRTKEDRKLLAAVVGLVFGCTLLTAGLKAGSRQVKHSDDGLTTGRRMLNIDETAPVDEPTEIETQDKTTNESISWQKLRGLKKAVLLFEDDNVKYYLGPDKDPELFSDEYDLILETEKAKALPFRIRQYKDKGTPVKGKFWVYLEEDRSFLTAVQENEKEQQEWRLTKEAKGVYKVNIAQMCDARKCTIRSTNRSATLLFGKPHAAKETGKEAPIEVETSTDTSEELATDDSEHFNETAATEGPGAAGTTETEQFGESEVEPEEKEEIGQAKAEEIETERIVRAKTEVDRAKPKTTKRTGRYPKRAFHV